jgi:hypothetical protein
MTNKIKVSFCNDDEVFKEIEKYSEDELNDKILKGEKRIRDGIWLTIILVILIGARMLVAKSVGVILIIEILLLPAFAFGFLNIIAGNNRLMRMERYKRNKCK